MNMNMTPGFTDPVTDAQTCFRAVLDAMARPGTVHRTGTVTSPQPLCHAAAAVLLTLADHETPLWLDPAAEGARPWIEFHTGAPVVASGNAMFALALSLPPLTELSSGSDEAPESAATLVLQVASLAAGRAFSLRGPGLRQPGTVTIDGLPLDFAAIWQRNHAMFPRGIDMILCAGDQLLALPRTVIIRDA